MGCYFSGWLMVGLQPTVMGSRKQRPAFPEAAANVGRAAFSGSRPVYLLGYNPGSSAADDRPPGDELNTVRSSIEKACCRKADRFSLYYREWEKERSQTMQRGIKRFFSDSGLCPGLTPSSNMLFRPVAGRRLHSHGHAP